MKTFTSITLLLVCGLVLSVSHAQQPTPMMVIQAASTQAAPVAPARTAANTNPEADAALQAALKCLQETKAANMEIMKKQEEMMEKLDDLQKAADQLKIFSKRTGG